MGWKILPKKYSNNIMKFIKIINREYNMVELPCGKVTNSININELDINNEIGNIIVRYNNEQKLIHKLNTNNNG